VLLPNAVWLMRWPHHGLLPRGHLSRAGAVRWEHIRMLMNTVRDVGFVGLGFMVGLAALWSP
jgi:hypothetical protein